MINTISDLIKEFLKAEEQVLSRQRIKQPVTIGNRYEGLAAAALQKGIFSNLDLRLSTRSFIQDIDNNISDEFDIILSVGEGEPVTYSPGQFIFKPSQVIAVFQIKKNLFAKDIKDSYLNLKNVAESFSGITTLENYQADLLQDAFRSICRKKTDILSQKSYTSNETCLFDSLKIEASLPVRIVIGFNGFKSKSNFRNAYIKYLNDAINFNISNSLEGYAPHELPDLIICGDYSIFKNNGMPFAVPISGGLWKLLATSNQNPMLLLLEYIWTRLSYMFSLSSDIFGEDLSNENGALLLSCDGLKLGDKCSWRYYINEMTEEELADESPELAWQPAFIEKSIALIITKLCLVGSIDFLNDPFINSLCSADGKTMPTYIDKLRETGLVFVEDSRIGLLTKNCRITCLKDGRYAAAEDNSGRFSRWLQKNDRAVK